jgi:hypothetical protein|tara:strand:+ start:1456 stop:1575 length:120 start_codon:yes stop_codon:yes gene_type:complete
MVSLLTVAAAAVKGTVAAARRSSIDVPHVFGTGMNFWCF